MYTRCIEEIKLTKYLNSKLNEEEINFLNIFYITSHIFCLISYSLYGPVSSASSHLNIV